MMELNNIFRERVMMLFGTMTQTQIAKLTGISQGKISELINCYTLKKKLHPSAELVYKIAKAFNVSTDYLLGLTDLKLPANESDIASAWSNGHRYGLKCAEKDIKYAVVKMQRSMNEILGEVEAKLKSQEE